MLFSSGVFIFIFLPVVLLGFHLTSKIGQRTEFLWLTAASLFFYGYWDARYLLVLVGSIAVNYLSSIQIARAAEAEDEARSRRWVIGAIAANLLILGFFKYFFPTLAFLHRIGLPTPDWVAVALPLGISFFTFTQIAYLIDLSQGAAQRRGLGSFALFVTFFPHLIAGPIIHHAEMMPQFEARQRKGLVADDLALGMTWFVLGLSKKVLIADRLAPVIDQLYASPHQYGFTASWIGVLAYYFQLYFDFSGYSDMALGLARMFSIRFPFNFDSPYKSPNIIDYWASFHMTLTRYLTAYLFNPLALAMNRRMRAAGKKINRNTNQTPEGFTKLIAFPILTTMFLAGVWHGAGLQFFLFGVLHGVYLVINHAWRVFSPLRPGVRKLNPWPVGVALTTVAIIVAQVFFRAHTVGDALAVLGGLAHLHGGLSLAAAPAAGAVPSTSQFMLKPAAAFVVLAVCFAIVWLFPNTQEILGQAERAHADPLGLRRVLRWQPGLISALVTMALFAGCFALLDASTSFLYFQF